MRGGTGTMHRGVSTLRFARVLAVVCIAAAAFTIGDVAPAAAEDLEEEGHTRYDVDIAGRAVHVTHDASATNNVPDRGNRYYYFSDISIMVLPEATNLAATRDDGRALPVRMEPAGDFAQAVVHIPNLLYRQTVQFTLTYDLPDRGPRAGTFTRVTDGLANFLAFGFGSPGRASFEVHAPAELMLNFDGLEMQHDFDGGAQVLSSGPIDDPQTSLTVITARDDSKLHRRAFEVGDRAIVIRSWPDDPDWPAFAEEKLTAGIPVLERLIGRPWPTEDELTVAESSSPYTYGYAGWYIPDADTIEIGDAFDALVLMHEVSHVWLNDRLMSDRWMDEGFAQVFSTMAMQELGEPTDPVPARAPDPPRFALAAWPEPLVDDTTGGDASNEEYGYQQSFAVAQAIADAVGMDGLRAIIESADTRKLTYAGDGELEDIAGGTDSRRLLDLLENSGAAGMQDLFSRAVLAPDDVARLGERSDARTQYTELVARGDGWGAPYPVRLAMAQWEFGSARARMADAAVVLETRDELATRAEDFDLALPRSLEEEYESAAELAPVETHAEALVAAADAIGAADAAVDGSHGLFGTVGLIGSDTDGALDEARAAFAAGDAPAAIDAAGHAEATVDDAASAGAIRLAIAAGVLLLIVAGVILVGRRRRRRAGRGPTTGAEPGSDASEPGSDAPEEMPWSPPPSSTPSVG